MLAENRGSGNTARRIHHLLPPAAKAGRLVAFEVFTPGGNWSSYPPHKHDTENPPVEALLTDCDVVLVPEGFHSFGAPAGYDAYYLNIMAGPSRAWRFTLDPDHSWLMNWSPPPTPDR